MKNEERQIKQQTQAPPLRQASAEIQHDIYSALAFIFANNLFVTMVQCATCISTVVPQADVTIHSIKIINDRV